MKKTLSLLLACIMLLACAAIALAAPNDGVLDISYSQTPDSLTPFRPETNRDAPFFTELCESLAVFDGNKELQPWLAKSWSTDDNGFTYAVELNEGIKDSEGNPYTAADAVWFISESKARALKPVFNKVESVEQTGELTFTLKLTSNIVGTFQKVMTETYGVTQAAFEASTDEFGTSLVCTSPYKVTSFVASSEFTLELQDNYWQPLENMPECVRPTVSKIHWVQIAEASQMGIALETGVVDMVMRMPISTGMQYEGNPAYTVEKTFGHQGYQAFFSGAESSIVANNQALRQAICYAIDGEAILAALCYGNGTLLYDAHSPIMIGYNPEWEKDDYYGYDLEKAKALLAESGYNGETISIMASASGDMPRLAQIMQAYMMQAGINVELNLVETAYYVANRLDGTKYDIVLNSIGGTYLADAWSIRYDPNAYATGDATSRKDYVLGDLLYATWTPEGYTTENINKVHEYLKESAIAYGLCDPYNYCVWRNDIKLTHEVYEIAGTICPAASTYEGI